VASEVKRVLVSLSLVLVLEAVGTVLALILLLEFVEPVDFSLA
jgi:hypothetical protein